MSKEQILAALRRNKPAAVDRPDVQSPNPTTGPLTEAFAEAVTSGAGTCLTDLPPEEWAGWITDNFSNATRIASRVAEVPGNMDLEQLSAPHALAEVDIAVLPARLGVAENGACWLVEEDMRWRVLPFITQ
ncbi:MAG: hypothetical protein KDC54_11660, partial [Lewinella sp.]|nr:hypothetical protein [Lewinella sp.]